ncbi:MAG: response regulator [Synergistaceae bacterium]|nr:response regulator [Synergistaceae bacterium]
MNIYKNLRERLYGIPELVLAKRLLMFNDAELDEYVKSLSSFVEDFPVEEAELKAAMETGNMDSVTKRLTGIRETLKNIYADDLADECWKRLNSFDRNRPEKMEAYVSFLLSTLAALSIDIQMAFFFEEAENDAAPAPVGEPGDPGKPADEQNAIKTILAVDDDTYSLDTFKSALKHVSCKIIGATSGLSALYMVKKLKPDLFVLDIEMPEMNGIELAEELRKQGQSAPVIFITGNATKEYVLKCMQVGASDFIVKPINPRGVVNRIKKFL